MQTMNPLKIAARFRLDGTPEACPAQDGGFINRTFLVQTDTGKRYILQKLSSAAFKDVPALMDNFCRVTEYLSGRVNDPRECLHVVYAQDGSPYVRDEDGEYWRMIEYVENSLCLQTPESPADFYESGVALGTFQRLLSAFPADTLAETIPDFHNTPKRFRRFHEVVEADPLGRLAEVREDVDFLLKRERQGAALQQMRDDGTLPVRVTHNDAKIGNVLLDKTTRKGLCVIDLDTVMPGLVAYDFGEAIRAGASTGEEDEQDLSKVRYELPLIRAFAEGFIPACGTLTKKEIDTLPLGVFLMALENGIRMLGDYIEGDLYYTSHYPKQTLYRARVQIKLVQEYERLEPEIRALMAAFS